MKIKNLLQAPLILEKAKELNIDLTNMDPNTRVKLIDGCLYFEGEKECFVSKAEPIETPLDICKRLYFEGVQFEVCTTNRVQTIPNDFRIDYEYGDVMLYLRGAQKYTLYSKSFDSFVKIIEPSGNSEQLEPEYYYLKETDRIEEGDECSKKPIYNNDEIIWHKVKYHIGRYAGDYKEFIVRRKIQRNTIPEDGC